MEREIWKKREKDKGDREVSRLKKGDTIECFNHDELEITEEGLTKDGYGFVETYDMTTMKWKIRITEVRKAKKNILTDMTDEELADHYYDMAHLPLTPETKEHDVAYFHDVVMEMAARFARNVMNQVEAEEAAGDRE